jgi:membrane protease YdiL (CAAX protease family)
MNMNTTILENSLVNERQGIRPLRPTRAVWHFLLAGIGLRLSVYHFLPFLVKQGIAPFEAFAVSFIVPTAILFALAFGSVKHEGAAITWQALANRFRLHRLRWRDFLWIGFGFIILSASFVLFPTQEWLIRLFPAIQPPATLPNVLNPLMRNETLPATIITWMGPEAIGNWGWVVLVLMLFFFNTFGEELYWRGVLLPRQELVHGRFTWLIHGIFWNLFHLPLYPWYFVYGLSITLTISFVAQKTGNTWAPILLHGLANLMLYTFMLMAIMGTL